MTASLTGLRVLDLSWVMVGPMTGRYLADLGADVIRVESRKRIDPLRTLGLWGLTAPAEHGGAALSMVDKCAVTETNHRCLVPIRWGGNALPPLYALHGEQKQHQRLIGILEHH